MATQRHELESWLGDVELTDEQMARLATEADRIDARYPNADDEDDREIALSAALAYLLGDTDTDQAGDELTRARIAGRRAMVAAQQVAAMSVEDGVAETEAARQVGIDRMTLRRVLGKMPANSTSREVIKKRGGHTSGSTAYTSLPEVSTRPAVGASVPAPDPAPAPLAPAVRAYVERDKEN